MCNDWTVSAHVMLQNTEAEAIVSVPELTKQREWQNTGASQSAPGVDGNDNRVDKTVQQRLTTPLVSSSLNRSYH